ncbi:hypothetical protein MMC28_011753 [Mycoblastus sanguinarius]|nr:hypothetical protein [Mycoblastus sanguinarius]
MSVPRKITQLLTVTAFIILFSFLHSLNKGDTIPSIRKTRSYEERFFDSSVWPLISNNGSDKVQTLLTSLDTRKIPVSSSRFHPGITKSLSSIFTRVIVLPRMKDEDISWIMDELPDVDVAVYIANDPKARLHPPRNKGHEVMIYLTYIIDHYRNLPDIIIFMHAHRWTHHNNELLDYDASEMIRRLSNEYVTREGFVNMRCHWEPGCPEWLHPDDTTETMEKQEESSLSGCWSELFPSDPIPAALGQACCSQFALSKERVLSIPLSRFIFYRDWILRTPLSDYISGRIWEYLWHFVFTGQSVVCPPEHACYCDGFGMCFGGSTEYQDFKELRRMKQDFESEREELRGREAPYNRKLNITLDSGRYLYLNDRIGALDKELAARKKMAMDRGSNPKNRAKECGRK